MKVRFADMRSPEIEEVLKKSNVVILPVGSTEQHGKHLPVNFDAFSVTYLAEETAKKVTAENDIQVLVAPTITYTEAAGGPPFEKPRPGDISISLDISTGLITDILRCLVLQGFKNILLLNGHWQNTPPISIAVRKVQMEFIDVGLFATNSYNLAQDVWDEVCNGGKEVQGHAGERETAVALAIEPENVRMEDAVYEGSHGMSLPPKFMTPIGRGLVFCNTRVPGVRVSGLHLKGKVPATKEAGEKINSATVDVLSEMVVAIAQSESMKHVEKD